HFGWKQALALRCEQVIHPEVVFGNVASGFRVGLPNGEVYVGGNTFGESLRQANFGPLPAAPVRTIFQALFERGEREIQQDGERQLVLKKIIEDVRRGIVASNDFIEGQHRAEVEIELLAELAVDLVHVAVELLEKTLEAIEHGIQRGLIAGEIRAR